MKVHKLKITLGLLFLAWGAHAHQPDLSTTVLMDQGKNNWVIQVSAALTAFEYEIENHYGKAAYSTPEEFQELVVKHLRENISIVVNGDIAPQLQNVTVRLGHETNVIFQLVGTPEDINTLMVNNESFKNIARNRGVVYILKEGYEKDQFTLNIENQHTVQLQADDTKFVLVEPEVASSFGDLWLVAIAVVALSYLGYLFYRNRKSIEVNVASEYLGS